MLNDHVYALMLNKTNFKKFPLELSSVNIIMLTGKMAQNKILIQFVLIDKFNKYFTST